MIKWTPKIGQGFKLRKSDEHEGPDDERNQDTEGPHCEVQSQSPLEAVLETKTLTQISQEHGVHPIQVSHWKNALLEKASEGFRGSAGISRPGCQKPDHRRLRGAVRHGHHLRTARPGAAGVQMQPGRTAAGCWSAPTCRSTTTAARPTCGTWSRNATSAPAPAARSGANAATPSPASRRPAATTDSRLGVPTRSGGRPERDPVTRGVDSSGRNILNRLPPPLMSFYLRSRVRIRAEEKQDWGAVHAVNASAFETPAEANLVDALREQAAPVISLIAETNGVIVGHIMFSPVSLSGFPALKIMGLAPMAVIPEQQREGIGSALVRAGLEQCKQLGFDAVVVLGHPEYYPRFGFLPAARFGIGCEFQAPEEAFMVLELQSGYLYGVSGTVKYHAVFSNV